MGRQAPHGPRRPVRPGRVVGSIVVALLGCLGLLAGAVVVAPERVAALVGAPSLTWNSGTPASPPPPVLPGLSETAPAPTSAGVAAALGSVIGDPALGRPRVSVVDPRTGESLYDRDAETSTLPASTAKLITAATVLTARGPAYRLTTRAVAGGGPGEVILVGGGDPTLAAGRDATYAGAARLDDLAEQVTRALGGTAPTRLVIDTSLFSGAGTGPGWDSDIATAGYGAQITALMIDGARTGPVPARGAAPRSPQPDIAAGRAFAAALGLPASAVTRGVAPAGARQLGAVQSPPMARLVDDMLDESDNVLAECLARQVALARGQPASYAGAAAAMKAVLAELGLPVQGYGLVDGSGLSRSNRLTPALLTATLALAAKPGASALAGLYTGLPVGGFSGTLRDRYRKPGAGAAAAGLVRAKTGTLSGVSAVSGFAVTADGRMLVFAVLAEGVGGDPTPSQEALDRVAAALAACGCR